MIPAAIAEYPVMVFTNARFMSRSLLLDITTEFLSHFSPSPKHPICYTNIGIELGPNSSAAHTSREFWEVLREVVIGNRSIRLRLHLRSGGVRKERLDERHDTFRRFPTRIAQTRDIFLRVGRAHRPEPVHDENVLQQEGELQDRVR